jgi:hypothetical protein
VAGLFGVCLVSFKIVNRRRDRFTRFFSGTNGVNLVPYGKQSLKRHHHFVIFHEVARQKQDFPRPHIGPDQVLENRNVLVHDTQWLPSKQASLNLAESGIRPLDA